MWNYIIGGFIANQFWDLDGIFEIRSGSEVTHKVDLSSLGHARQGSGRQVCMRPCALGTICCSPCPQSSFNGGQVVAIVQLSLTICIVHMVVSLVYPGPQNHV